MILVIGGLNGFVGSNTTEALVQLGHDCVVTRHTDAEVPPFLQKYIGRPVFVEQVDATKIEDLRRVGEKHKIDGTAPRLARRLPWRARPPSSGGAEHG